VIGSTFTRPPPSPVNPSVRNLRPGAAHPLRIGLWFGTRTRARRHRELCLIAYDFDNNDLFRRSALYVDRILRGEKPDDLPVQGPVKFELIVNLIERWRLVPGA
jgi:hypothetical protein